jgi:hypothetical protein
LPTSEPLFDGAAQGSRSAHAEVLKQHFADPSPGQGLGAGRRYALGRLAMGLEKRPAAGR